ncbi:hypothetical protein CBG25_12880, partial [Arsenophonus sp. ENCA]|uniref:hypothetical protein n=1 Tax=Arsenophonus sp. ENCA TaxID=1987579 RepID=UPI000BC681A1
GSMVIEVAVFSLQLIKKRQRLKILIKKFKFYLQPFPYCNTYRLAELSFFKIDDIGQKYIK